MGLSTTQLEAFLAVSQTLNFTLAAEKLHVTQSALSQRIINLESELGTTLLIRDRAGIRLTEVGSALVRYCQVKNSFEEEFLSSIRSQDKAVLSGTIRVGGFSTVTNSVILPSLSSLLKQNTKMKLQLVSREWSDLFSLLKRGEIDYLVSDDQMNRDEFERILLGVEKNVLVAAKDETESERFLDHDESDQTTIKYLKKFKILTKNLDRIYLDDIYGILEGLKLGLGKAVVPEHLIPKKEGLVVLNSGSVLEVPVYLYFYSQPFYSKLHSSIVEALILGFKKILK